MEETQQWKIGFYLSPEVVKNPLLRVLLKYKGTFYQNENEIIFICS